MYLKDIEGMGRGLEDLFFFSLIEHYSYYLQLRLHLLAFINLPDFFSFVKAFVFMIQTSIKLCNCSSKKRVKSMQHLWLCKQCMLEQLLLHAFDSNGVYRSLNEHIQSNFLEKSLRRLKKEKESRDTCWKVRNEKYQISMHVHCFVSLRKNMSDMKCLEIAVSNRISST